VTTDADGNYIYDFGLGSWTASGGVDDYGIEPGVFGISHWLNSTGGMNADHLPITLSNRFHFGSHEPENELALKGLLSFKAKGAGGAEDDVEWEVEASEADGCLVKWSIVAMEEDLDVHDDEDYYVPEDGKFWVGHTLRSWQSFMKSQANGGCMDCDMTDTDITYTLQLVGTTAATPPDIVTPPSNFKYLKVIFPAPKVIGGWKTDPIWSPGSNDLLSSLNDVRDEFQVGGDEPYENTDKTFVVWNMGSSGAEAKFSWGPVVWLRDPDFEGVENPTEPTWWRTANPVDVVGLKMISTSEITVSIKIEPPTEDSVPILAGTYTCNLITKDKDGVEFGNQITLRLTVPPSGAAFSKSLVTLK
tara:strand:+ start:533 stop:1612 length:1080 start_codon:yes stop_codon:yes gene_type:complete